MSNDTICAEVEALFLLADQTPPIGRAQWQERTSQLPDLCQELAELVGYPLEVDDNYQDAGCYATIDLRLLHKGSDRIRLSLSFSLFSELVAVDIDRDWTEQPSAAVVQALTDLLSSRAFVPIPVDQFSYPYTGDLRASDGTLVRLNEEHDWSWRFLDFH